ncbi:hypothetical protein [Pseudomonas fluorescens]|uniref:Uncharacterized protein n=1 Tax=Pseudomonas fluorescens TaxID=294 RepID=A0A944HIK5_PSEFL|nr:hypothetical protein [Pseudomonas fluorescens]MBT2297665.1 hypothetical protein [Pseudomonas fluorescens]MBT2305864.1 hypothetical protein [Pseudomonas fluorescens]MBT2314114.1 hypothetical protein [Pseudomonas fluorescens]MBT2319394.1 hypothetical protein [Pseudomonas fluorescens]MBT2329188.1 hypothetical protein [Pseudomonas fluorescens]
MVLSVSASYLPPAHTSLTPSEQKLTAVPLTDAAKQALANATPAAIYHPSEEAKAWVGEVQVIETWVGRSQSPEFPRLAEIANDAMSGLKGSFEEFQSTLATEYPDLASKKYGFTVEADGSLKVLDIAKELSASDIQRLTELLNESSGLKAAASAFRDASIDMVDADSPWSGSYLGRYSLTQENFAKSIDLAALVIPKGTVPNREQIDGMFFNQLAAKGELATRETEAAMLQRRAAQAFTAQA